MLRRLPFLLAALAASAPAAAERPLSVRHVVRNAEALDGQVVELRGWIDQCQRLSCVVYHSSGGPRRRWPYFLSVGPSPWFDARVQRSGPGPITLRARVHADCISDPAEKVIALCTDRANSLEPLAILR